MQIIKYIGNTLKNYIAGQTPDEWPTDSHGVPLVAFETNSNSENVTGSSVTMTARSGSIAAGTTSQQLMAANAARKYLFIQNPYSGQGVTAENLYVRFGASAAGIDDGTSIELLPGASLTYDATAIPTQAIQVNATTTAHKFIALEG